MGCIKVIIGIALVAAGAIVFAAPSAAASTDLTPNEVMQASGGLTLGSAALVGLAGLLIAFGGRGEADPDADPESNTIKLRRRTAATEEC